MEKWNKPKQPFSLNLLLVAIMGVIISFFTAILISYWGGDSLLVGSLIKGIIVFIAFLILFYIQAKVSHPIYDIKHVQLLGLIAFLVIFFYPIYLETQNPLFDPSNYQMTSYSIIPSANYSYQGNTISYIFFHGIQFVVLAMLIIGSIYIAYLFAYLLAYGREPNVYSKKYEKFYKTEYSKRYNVYVNDNLENLSNTLDFKMVIQFLNDGQRFQEMSNVKKQFFIVFSLPEETQKIIEIHGLTYLLSKEESLDLSNNLDTSERKNTRSEPIIGSDLLMHITINSEEAVSGLERDIEVLHTEQCTNCGGFGKIQGLTCKTCSGKGILRVTRKVSVNIPAGIHNSIRLRLKEFGDAGVHGGRNGDLFIEVHIQ
jgi:hypothetical protein